MADQNDFLKTCFVVGAGASVDFDFPTGDKLVTRISDLLNVRDNERSSGLASSEARGLRDAIVERKVIKPELSDFRLISKSMPLAPSIDNFLQAHSANAKVVALGKAAIAHEILKAERASALYFKSGGQVDYSAIRGKWLPILFRLLAEGSNWSAFLKKLSQITFICFNYDRLIERFFFLACMQYFGKAESEVAAALQEKLEIKHPYGKVGGDVFTLHQSGFGEHESAWEVINAADDIKTFTEGMAEDSCDDYFASFFERADALCFLGFGFHSINMGHLAASKELFEFDHVLGTAMCLSTNYVDVVKDELKNTFVSCSDANIIFENCDCSKLLLDYSAVLSGRNRRRGIISWL